MKQVSPIIRWTFGPAYAVLFVIAMTQMIERGGWWILAGVGMILLTIGIRAYLGEKDTDSSGADVFFID